MEQDQRDLERHLRDAREALSLSSTSYDQGYKGEAKRLATSVRVLVHDTRNSISLLTQLNKKDIQYVTTPGKCDPNNRLKGSHLTRIRVGLTEAGNEYLEFMPRLDDFPPSLSFRTCGFDEWRAEPVVIGQQNMTLSRSEIVLALANKDGGTHVDPILGEKYADFSRRNSVGWIVVGPSGENVPEYGPEYGVMRQIAHEMSRTLDREFGPLE